MMQGINLILLTTIISACENAPRVEIDNQTLIGKYSQNKKIASFLGIPFAEAPVGKLRWAAPIPFKSKNSKRMATDFSPACMQHMGILEWYRDLAEIFGNDRNVVADLPIDEDCLYLNIWTPVLDEDANLPVMVYIHGGSNDSGFSGQPTGYRCGDGSFQNAGKRGYWWSQTAYSLENNSLAHYIRLVEGQDDVNHFHDETLLGFAVRCLKD